MTDIEKERAQLRTRYFETGRALDEFCFQYRTPPFGLISDECRKSPEFKQLTAAFKQALKAYRSFNKQNKPQKRIRY